MNTEKLKRLRDHIETLSAEKFDYSIYLPDNLSTKWIYGKYMPECGTTGCVAGHAISLFQIPSPGRFCAKHIATLVGEYLDLSENETYFLFCANLTGKDKQDAVRRIDWLLSGKSYADYPWINELKNELKSETILSQKIS